MGNNMEIEYYIKQVYGKPLIYIKDAHTARLLINLTGKKTITEDHQSWLSNLTSGWITWKQVLP
jgi:hypothetical protein